MFSTKNCSSKIRFSVIIAFTVLIGGYSSASMAGVADKTGVKKEFDATFLKMLDDPANIDLTMHYANLAVQLEDYESAIPPLERILMFNPDLPRVKQELGVLYYRLNSFDMAKSYLEDAKKGKNVPKDVIDKANSFLTKIN